MSTRCHIRIKDGRNQFKLYHHSDGYPEGVGLDLKKYLEAYDKAGNGSYRNSWWGEEIANQLVKGAIKIQRLDLYSKESKYKIEPDDGYEITSCIHGDEEYVYVIDCKKKTLTCYEMRWDEKFEEVIKANRVVEIPDEEENSQNP